MDSLPLALLIVVVVAVALVVLNRLEFLSVFSRKGRRPDGRREP
jgi:hypothetical protein